MAMSKKHFEFIASAFVQNRDATNTDTTTEHVRRDLAERLCVRFIEENPLFDRARFMKACGFKE